MATCPPLLLGFPGVGGAGSSVCVDHSLLGAQHSPVGVSSELPRSLGTPNSTPVTCILCSATLLLLSPPSLASSVCDLGAGTVLCSRIDGPSWGKQLAGRGPLHRRLTASNTSLTDSRRGEGTVTFCSALPVGFLCSAWLLSFSLYLHWVQTTKWPRYLVWDRDLPPGLCRVSGSLSPVLSCPSSGV
jgi:hypothetical protein